MDLFGEPDPAEEAVPATPEAPEEGQESPETVFGVPRQMDICLGHERIESALLNLYTGGRFPHALVFAGPKGIGKATMAYRLARFLLKHGVHDDSQGGLFGAEDQPDFSSLQVDASDPVFARVASGGHPDLFTVERAYDEAKNRFKSGVEVDEIRKIAPFLRMTSSAGGWRVVIVDDADTMNRNAQNALLKILEEPPKNTVLILVAHRPGALIPTIRSRTRTLAFHALSDEHMRTLLPQADPALGADAIEGLIRLSEGSIGKAVECIENDGLEVLGTIFEMLAAYPSWSWPDIHKLADRLAHPGAAPSYSAFRQQLQWLFENLARAKARGQGLGTQENPALQEILRNSSLEQLLKICENLQSHFGKVEAANLDKRYGVLGAFSLIAA